jgi:hypothetical protein
MQFGLDGSAVAVLGAPLEQNAFFVSQSGGAVSSGVALPDGTSVGTTTGSSGTHTFVTSTVPPEDVRRQQLNA